MFINWLIGEIGRKRQTKSDKMYPVVFSIREDEVNTILDWMKNHNCCYAQNNTAREILNGYTNNEIINNGFLSMAFEQYGNDGSKNESDISIVLIPSVMGTRYKVVCRCGEEFEPGALSGKSRISA